jgi:adenylate cyclase
LPYLFQLTLAGNLLLYIYSRNFDFFRFSQLTLFLFAPFAMQWSIGNFITGSGIILWGLLAPFGAILCYGVRESIVWFLAWMLFTAMTGVFDFLLADAYVTQKLPIPLRTSMVFFALNFIAVASIIYVLLRYAIQEKRKIQERLEEAHRQLLEARYRSERLLLNILPAPVAERLEQGEKTLADGFPAATVMFADLVDFTRVASQMTPQQVFGMLNDIFSAFDDLCDRFHLEKIKTIGDAYMVAGGLNQTLADPAAACAGSRLSALCALPVGNPWKTLRVSHRLPTGRRLPTSSTALRLQSFKSGNVKTISPAPALAYSSTVAVQTTGPTAQVPSGNVCSYRKR